MVKQQPTQKAVTLSRLLHSFKYAANGLSYAFKNEHHMFSWLIATVIVVICGLVFKISAGEWIICLIMIGLVAAAELFNSALEAAVDLAQPTPHPLAKAAKDMASAAVLVLAITAGIVGLIIFVPKIIALF